jgi:hypothetical protein
MSVRQQRLDFSQPDGGQLLQIGSIHGALNPVARHAHSICLAFRRAVVLFLPKRACTNEVVDPHRPSSVSIRVYLWFQTSGLLRALRVSSAPSW